MTDGRTRLELVAAGARDRDLFIFGMDAGFHGNLEFSVAAESITAASGVATPWTLMLPADLEKSMPETRPRIICAPTLADKGA